YEYQASFFMKLGISFCFYAHLYPKTASHFLGCALSGNTKCTETATQRHKKHEIRAPAVLARSAFWFQNDSASTAQIP
ncbi:hypothetical protein, partial [Asticcacaulis biprosthecium]|uniref:hypothetical protein n=1 Tax=Asticcacaulis biprosthecium TaxID=76891 RepID=UPI001B7FB1D2